MSGFGEAAFDIVIVREEFRKQGVKAADAFKECYRVLKPGGKLFLVDLCRAEQTPERRHKLSPGLVEYKNRMNWTLFPLSGYEQLASQMAGFEAVQIGNWSQEVAETLGCEVLLVEGLKQEILEEYGVDAYMDTTIRWANLKNWLVDGELVFGVVEGVRPEPKLTPK